MSQPEITARKIGYYAPVTVVGTDAEGRTVVICPVCREEAYVDPQNSRVVCPIGEAFLRQIEDAYRALADQ